MFHPCHTCRPCIVVIHRTVLDSLPAIGDKLNGFDSRCRKIPKYLKAWAAYTELRSALADFQEVQIYVSLSFNSWRERPWFVCSGTSAHSFVEQVDIEGSPLASLDGTVQYQLVA